MSLGNEENTDGADDDPDLRMPYRKRKRFYETPQPQQEKWREACYRAHPDLDSLPEEQREAVESRIKVEYYIALGLDTSLPRTATSGSIETPMVSPLLQRPPRVPSRKLTVPVPAARPMEPMGPLPPLTVPSLPLRSQSSPLLPVPPLAPLSPHSPLPRLPPIPPGSLPPRVPTNPYLSPIYIPYEQPFTDSGPIKPLRETIVKLEEKPFLDFEKNIYLKEDIPVHSKSIKPQDDFFIKPIHPVSKPFKNTFIDPPKETSLPYFTDTPIEDPSLKFRKPSHFLEEGEPPYKRTKTDFDPKLHQTETNLNTHRERREDTYKNKFFEPIGSSGRKDTNIQEEGPLLRKPVPFESFYSPSTSSISVPKFGQSSSIYVDCPSIYPMVNYLDLREQVSDNNNDNSVQNFNTEDNDEPIDYSLNHPSNFHP